MRAFTFQTALSSLTNASESRKFQNPIRLGPYELLGQIGTGRASTVYLGRARGSQGSRHFAIKCLHSDLVGNKDYMKSLFDERQLASQIPHPNVCPIFDVGNAKGTYYLVMEYVVGEPLSRIVDVRGRPSHTRAFEICARLVYDVCDGMQALLSCRSEGGEYLDSFHRYVSLENLFVSYDGTMRIVDSGLPFEANCSPVWSLGVVFWELLAGRRLFPRDLHSEMHRALSHPVPSLREVNPAVPPALERIVLRALSQDPYYRYNSVTEMENELERFLSHCPDPVGVGEIAVWINRLFPTGAEYKMRWVQQLNPSTRSTPAPANDATPVTGWRGTFFGRLIARLFSPGGSAARAHALRLPSHDPSLEEKTEALPEGVRLEAS